MKMVKMMMVGAALTLGAGAARGEHMWENPGGWWGGHFAYEVSMPRYTAYEFSFDAFGSYQTVQDNLSDLFDTTIKHGLWGGGVGLNYFFTRNIGLGVDANAQDNRGNFIDQVSLSLLARLPLGASGWAPYIYGGGGRATDPQWEWLVHGGVGIEYRWNPTTGIFIDGRYVWTDETFDRLVLRAGMRLIF